MPANIAEINGKSAIAFYGLEPWHHLGTRLNNVATAEEMIQAASLDWNVLKQPIAGSTNGHYELVREARAGTNEVNVQLGRCTKAYEPLQNRDAFAFFDGIVSEGSAIFHTAGALGDGERIWVLAKLPSSIVVSGNDIVDKYLLLTNTHNGGEAVTVKFTPIRVVCQNTLSAALRDGSTAVRIKHTASMMSRLSDVPGLLGLSHDVFAGLEEAYAAMAEKALQEQDVFDYLNSLMPMTETQLMHKVAKSKMPKRWEAVLTDFEAHPITETKGTLWALYNAFTHYIDYAELGRKKDESSRLERVWYGEGAAVKVHALNQARKVLAG